MTVRKSTLNVKYNGIDITKDVSNFITSFSFIERAKHGESDELNISFENIAKLWNNGWFPERGASLLASLHIENWYKPGDSYVIDCGSFEIDDLSDSGPPSTFSLGSLSVGITSSIRGESNSRAWENIRLSVIIDQLASKHGFKTFFQSDYNPIFTRFDQKKQSDLAFILKIAEYAGLQVRLSHNKLIVYQDSLFDQQDASLTITKDYDGYINHNFRASSSNIFMACQVSYLDSKKSKLLTYQYSVTGDSGTIEDTGGTTTSTAQKIDPITRMVVPGKESTTEKNKNIEAPLVGKILKINRRVESLAEAEKLAKSLLRNQNRQELSGSISLMGNPILRAGMSIAISGFGRWDTARWIIEEVSHEWSKSGGLSTQISIRGAMRY